MSALQSFVSSERTSSLASRNSAVLGALLGVVAVLTSCSSDAPAIADRVATESSVQPRTSVAVEIPTIDTTAPLVPTAAGTATTTRTAPSVGLYALTGLPAPDEESLFRPAIAAKIDNVEAARPQAGLVQADLVYEEIVEGGLTRLLAIFHSTSAPVLGPIRSARSTDVPLLTPLREPLFAWSGANEPFSAFIRSFAIRDVGVEAAPGAYERLPDRSPPSDLMTSTDALYALISLGEDLAPKLILEHLMPGELPRTGEAVDSVAIDYGATTVTHRWDAELGGWVRFQNGSRHGDVVGDAIAPENVIVQFVTYRDSGLVDSAGAVVPVAELRGSGPAWFLRNGLLTMGSWTKLNATTAAQYFDATGEPMVFVAGRTWILLAREGTASLR